MYRIEYKVCDNGITQHGGSFIRGVMLPLTNTQRIEFGQIMEPRELEGLERPETKLLVSVAIVTQTSLPYCETISMPCTVLLDSGVYDCFTRPYVRVVVSKDNALHLISKVQDGSKHLRPMYWRRFPYQAVGQSVEKVVFETKLDRGQMNMVYLRNLQGQVYQDNINDVFLEYASDLHGIGSFTIYATRIKDSTSPQWKLRLNLRAFEVIPPASNSSWTPAPSVIVPSATPDADVPSQDLEGLIFGDVEFAFE